MLKFLDKNIKRVCVLGNQHGLLQYLLLSSLDEIGGTFFLWNFRGIPKSVISRFGKGGAIIPSPPVSTGLKILDTIIWYLRFFFDYHIYYPIKFPFLLSSKYEYWGHDHVHNAHCFFRKHPFRLLEDGLLNYGPALFIPSQRFIKLKRLLTNKSYSIVRYAGEETNCTEILLTGLLNEGEVLKDPKVRIKSFIEMWNDSDIKKKSFINYLFGVSPHMINECRKFKHILLTQPFSEIGLLSEEEKIDMFKQVLIKIGEDNVAIKPHPLETTDYSRFFSNNLILNTSAPMQLLSLNGIRFESAYSVNSTALFDFPYKIKVCVLGSEIYPPLYRKRPEWTSDTVKITNKNVELIKL